MSSEKKEQLLAVDILEQDIADLDMTLFKILLQDKTTKGNIIWGTDAYEELGYRYSAANEILPELVLGVNTRIIQPRVSKSQEEQTARTRKRAEVFTPSWICNKMNNHCDAEWFGREDVFNTEDEHSWIVNPNKVEFSSEHTWQEYVDSRRLEITCGEAPYLVSRYDTTTGEIIPIESRIGILDRKLRIVNENTVTEEEWNKWVIRAFQSTYGYEFQGDNLLLARINLIAAYFDYVRNRWGKNPTVKQLREVANIISWNIWQMDGLSGTVPFKKVKPQIVQMALFVFEDEESESVDDTCEECLIYDWRARKTISFNSLKGDSNEI